MGIKNSIEYIEYSEDKATITLSRPLSIDGTKVPKVTMREPTVRDEMLARKMTGTDSVDNESTLLANLCGILKEDLQNMSLKDYRRLQEAFLGFLE